jgi:uncharacterized protein
MDDAMQLNLRLGVSDCTPAQSLSLLKVCLLLYCVMGGGSPAEASRSTLRICTGSATGHYYRVGQVIAKALSKDAKVSLIETKGSWENLGRIHADNPQCDAIIAQDDAVAVYLYEHPVKIGMIERVLPLYKEYIQLVCNQYVKAEKFSEIHPDTRILTGAYGTGTFITWTLIKRLNPNKYGILRELELGGDEALKQLTNINRPQCLLVVNALAQGVMVKAHDDLGQNLKLINLMDPSFQLPINQAGTPRALYSEVNVHKNVYPLLLDSHLKTQTVEAVFFVHSKWMRAHPQLSEVLSRLLIKRQRSIQGAVD